MSTTTEFERPTVTGDDVSGLLREKQALIRQLRSENKHLRQELQRMMVYRSMAYRDALTGLHNRRYFDERLREECARSLRIPGYAFGVILVDLDDFKTVNDTLGHAIGDQVLCAVANLLLDGVREVDICCRLGGDEFALLLPTTDEAGCRVVVERLRRGQISVDGDLPSIGLSIGAASHPPGPANAERILSQADTAMYLDKRRRKVPSRRVG